jgi:CelD/BcsL family acetyltransferase involved in cellulose biosynthesis
MLDFARCMREHGVEMADLDPANPRYRRDGGSGQHRVVAGIVAGLRLMRRLRGTAFRTVASLTVIVLGIYMVTRAI